LALKCLDKISFIK